MRETTMIPPYQDRFTIRVEKQGPVDKKNTRPPVRFGKYSEIRTSDYEFLFNLNGEIKFIRGLNVKWPHPAEQLKRTDGNDWVYYSVGDDSSDKGVISWMGEYYLPCLPYPSNPVWDVNYFSNPNIMSAFAAWSQLYANLYGIRRDGLKGKAKDLIRRILDNNDKVLFERSQALSAISGGRISVLPPDTRHVDYEIIPLMISDGCLYHCGFCCVKSPKKFQERSGADVLEQMRRLKAHYGQNLGNYYALFLGNHDALAASGDLICLAAAEAHKAFGFDGPAGRTPLLFLFGSVSSLLRAENELLEKLDQLPFYTYINIGFESVDDATLKSIRKPVEAARVQEAFRKMLEINATYSNIEITGNFLMGGHLSPDHYQSLAWLLRNAPAPPREKGAIYLSPLKDSPKKRELLPQFTEIKNQSELPAYIYLIQRL